MSHRIISTILRHDGKQTSYKIALLRALNDVVLAYPDVGRDGRDVAVPLRSLAEAWVAYYWPFVAAGAPILQGVASLRREWPRQDVGFRAHLTGLRRAWEEIYGPSGAAGGWATGLPTIAAHATGVARSAARLASPARVGRRRGPRRHGRRGGARPRARDGRHRRRRARRVRHRAPAGRVAPVGTA